MKKNYTNPEITIVEIEIQDVLLQSSQASGNKIESLKDNGSHGDW